MRHGFIDVDQKYVNTYEICEVKAGHGENVEMVMTNGKIIYAKGTPGEMMERIYMARSENEGRE